MSTLPRMNGYEKLASLMGPHPELAIFRRFAIMNAHNLLLLQAELVHLEGKLHKSIEADYTSGHADRVYYDRDWQSLFESESATDGNSDQWRTIVRIRSVMKDYHEALQYQAFMAERERPLSRDLNFLQQWMNRPTMGFVYLLGGGNDIYEKPNLADLIVVKHAPTKTLATRWVGDYWAKLRHRLLRKKQKSQAYGIYANTIHYSGDTLANLGGIIGTVCASTLPVLSIVVLYLVQAMSTRLAIIGVFTSLFSAVLGLFSDSRRIEIFAATAGFAAVQVVFVGTTSNTNAFEICAHCFT